MADFDAEWLRSLDNYIALFRDAFRRREQAHWAAVYLQGLLRPGGRKTIGGMVRRVAPLLNLMAEDAAQALQHFVNQSPWDEAKVWRHYRGLMAKRLAGPDGWFVLDDPAFVKQGRHSVGVQRQYSGALGRKTNCQIAVTLYYASPAGSCPLDLRLYLPRGWLQQPHRLDAAGVPEGCRRAGGKGAIALELLDQVRSEGWPAAPVAAGAAFGGDREFREALSAGGWTYLLEAPANVDLGLGETLWPAEGVRTWVGNGRTAPGQAEAARRAAAEAGATLTAELGLDHFEGRSWRGFHHHVCLVMLAYGFRFFLARRN